MASKAYECWNEYWADVESNEDYSALTFYHGTSDALDISCILPAAETGFLREDWRKKLTDKVFLTDSLYSAQKYAKKACSIVWRKSSCICCTPRWRLMANQQKRVYS